jgi:Tfp pilus assembly protein PilF
MILAILAGGSSAGCSSIPQPSIPFSQFVAKESSGDPFSLARLAEKRGDLEKAAHLYGQLVESQPDHGQAHHRLAIVHSRQSHDQDARKHFERAIEITPAHATLHSDLGYHLFTFDHFADAEKALRRAIELDPGHAAAWSNLALVFSSQQRFDEARVAFQRNARSPAEYHCDMAYVFAQAGEFQLAQSEYNLALQSEPENAVAIHGLLDVSKQIPGKEPVVVAKTQGTLSSEPRAKSTSEQVTAPKSSEGNGMQTLETGSDPEFRAIEPYSFTERK